MVFKGNFLHTSLFSDQLKEVMFKAADLAADSRSPCIRPGHILLAILEIGNEEVLYSIKESLNNCALADLGEAIRGYLWDDPSKPVPAIDFSTETFSEESLNVFKELQTLTLNGAPMGEISTTHFLLCVLRNLDKDDRDILSGGLSIDSAIQRTESTLTKATQPRPELPPLFDPASGKLQVEYFDTVCVEALNAAVRKAGQMGYTEVRPPHLVLGLLSHSEGITVQVIRLQVHPNLGLKGVIGAIEHSIDLGPSSQQTDLSLVEHCFSSNTKVVLNAALSTAIEEGREHITEHYFFKALLTHSDSKLKSILQHPPLAFNLSKMLEFVEQKIKAAKSQLAPLYKSVNWPEYICPAIDLTQLAQDGKSLSLIGRIQELEEIKRGLFKREDHNLLLYGERGVGKTALVYGLALEIAQGSINFLQGRPVLMLDISNIKDDEAREKSHQIFALAESQPWGIYVIDQIDRLLRENKQLFQTKLKDTRLMFIGILSTEGYSELVADDEELRRRFICLEIKEPSKEESIQILQSLKSEIENAYGISINDICLEKAVKLSHDFIMNERLPGKAIRVLKAACDNSRYEIQSSKALSSVTSDYITKEIARITQLPETMIKGIGEDKDYYTLLSKMVAGQEEAIRKVADRLDLIQKGMVDKKQPAAIFIFAGLAGTGKTELAKAIASLYSTSKKLIVFPMEEGFDKPESVTKLFGAPPGYVGYEQGGELINKLNADPYAVVLLDEVEKAHPAIWNAFLNLFGEGWARDGRGVEARGNKAFFVLTSNIGAELISGGLKGDIPVEKIIENVQETIHKAIHRETGQRCFSEPLLRRIHEGGGVVIFKPLSLSAVTEITRLKLQTLREEWLENRDLELVFDPNIVELIAKLSYQDMGPEGRFGGSAVVNRINNMIKIALSRRLKDFVGARAITLSVDYSDDGNEEIAIKIESSEEETNRSHQNELPSELSGEMKRLQQVANKILQIDKMEIELMSPKQKEKLTQALHLIAEVL